MARPESSTPHRISKIPVLSTEYKRTLREVKEKKLAVESKEAEVVILERDLRQLTLVLERPAEVSTESTQPKQKQWPSTTPPKILPPASKEPVRSVIRTPKGTKRKGMSVHLICEYK